MLEMAQCKQTAQECINNAFAPMVAALCSHDAELVCQKNNLSFCELIQPFCRLTSEAHIRDPGNVSHPIHNLHVNVREMGQVPPNPTMARKMLNDVVANAQPQTENSRSNVLTVGDYDLQLSASTPWYETYRDTFLQVSVPSDHEFLKHYLACIFVVTSNHPDPMEQFSKLTQQQHQQQHQNSNKLPKWFCPNILRYYVLIHDVVDADEAKAESIYQNMKSTYGVNACHLLQINSRTTTTPENATTNNEMENLPDPWTQFLSKKPSNFTQESADYDTTSQYKMENEAFPTKLAEGTSNDLTPQNSVEDATEATEEVDTQQNQQQTSIAIDHPLAQDSPDSGTASTNDVSDDAEPDNRIPRDNENNALGSGNRDKAFRSSQHGQCLTLSDHDRIRIFVHEFIVRGFLPWAERTLRTLSEQLTSRKGIHRSFFNATKKWFSGSKPGGPAAAMQEKANVVYTMEAPEMQTRRLADLAFMVQLYEIAYQTYQICKRDFNNDHAWLYFAGATEMACTSVFMQGASSQRQYPHLYMDTAVTTYLSTCKSPQFATRATMLSTEALKSRGMFAEAAMQFIKMTSEDSDLRSALLLEQAAHCFINMKTPMVRKFSFHMILAGHRFGKAGQRKHALRSYSQALQVYKGKNWTLAEDHINFTIGRQSFNLKQLENASAAFKHLLSTDSKQTPPQQAAFLREYLFVFKQLLSQASQDGVAVSPDPLPQLPLPVVDGNNTKVLLCSLVNPEQEGPRQEATSVTFETPEKENVRWQKLEELVLVRAGGVPSAFKPSLQCFTNRTANSANPVAVMGEPILVEVQLGNPLRIPLILTDVLLLWRFIPVDFSKPNAEPANAPPISNEVDSVKNPLADEVVETQVISELVLAASESKPSEDKIHLRLTARQTGELRIVGLAYNLGTSSPPTPTPTTTPASTPGTTSPAPGGPPAGPQAAEGGGLAVAGGGKAAPGPGVMVRGRLSLDVQGPRLNSAKAEKASKMYGPDRRLDLVIAPEMPLLEVHFTGFPRHLLCGEVQHVMVDFTNKGRHPLLNLQVSSSHPGFFTFGQGAPLPEQGTTYQTLQEPTDSGEYHASTTETRHVIEVALPGGRLAPGASVSLPMWIRGPDTSGRHKVDFLFYYESAVSNPKLRHRVLRHTAEIQAYNSIGVRASASRSSTCSRADPARPLNAILVTVEVENLNQVNDPSVAEVSLLQVSCASCRWHLRHLSAHSESEVKIKSRETVMLSFKAHTCHLKSLQKDRVSEGKCEKGSSGSSDIIFTNVSFDQQQINSALTPCADFYCRSKDTPAPEDLDASPLSLTFHPHDDKGRANTPADDLEQALQAGLTVIVIWKALVSDGKGEGRQITGQHHVTLDRLNALVVTPPTIKNPVEEAPVKIIKDYEPDQVTLPSELTLSQLVTVHLLYDQIFTHDFSRSRVATVTVQVQLFNCSVLALRVEVDTTRKVDKSATETARPPSAAYSSLVHDTPTSTFTWAGHTVTRLKMAAADSHVVTLRACFVKPGVYNLSQLVVNAAPSNPVHKVNLQMTAQRLTCNSLITIRQVAAPS